MSGVVGCGEDDGGLGAMGDRHLFSVLAVKFFSGQGRGCAFADVGKNVEDGK